MKFVSFRRGDRASFGTVVDDGKQVADLGAAGDWRDLIAFLEATPKPKFLQDVCRSAPHYSIDELTLRPPIPTPGKIVCVGINYGDHALETNNARPPHPSLFIRFPNSFVGHGEAIVAPRLSHQLDWEGELAFVIGRAARHVPADEAGLYIAGYTCCAENSVRDFQKHSTQVTAGKNFKSSGAMGPWLVTPDEVQGAAGLRLLTRVNGRIVQEDNTANMIFQPEDILAYVSQFTELAPGDVIATGTPAGIGARRTPPEFLRPGDLLEVEIDGIGVLRNPVVAE